MLCLLPFFHTNHRSLTAQRIDSRRIFIHVAGDSDLDSIQAGSQLLLQSIHFLLSAAADQKYFSGVL